jgi:hypothetical protein
MAVKVRNTTVNGGLTGRDTNINKTFSFKQGQNHSIMKKTTNPTDRKTLAQTRVRDIFAQTSRGWSQLHEEQRVQWNNEAPNWENTGIFGVTRPSGKNLYTGCNVALVSAGKDPIDEPSRKELICILDSVVPQIDSHTATLDLNLVWVVNDAEEVIEILVSPQLSAGTSKTEKFSIIKKMPCVDDGISFYEEYVSKYGALKIGSKIFYKIKLISKGGNSVNYTSGFLTVI